MYSFGIIHIDRELEGDLISGAVEASDVLDRLKEQGLLVVVEMQDHGWAQIDPPLPVFFVSDVEDEGQALTAEDNETEVLFADDHPVVEGQPGGFGNLGG